jgi:hypothetical protein
LHPSGHTLEVLRATSTIRVNLDQDH